LAAADISDFTTAAAAAAPVQSVNGNTGTVTVAVPSASTATPSALGVAAAGTSNDFARGDHVHAMPSASDVGAAADDDARLSDSRDPNAHAASHLPEGDDELFDQSLNTTDTATFARLNLVQDEAEGSLIVYDEGDGTFFEFAADNSLVLTIKPDEAVFYNPIQIGGDDPSANAATTRTNLGLGDSATADIGTTEGTVAAGDDSRFSDIPDPSTATPQALGAASAGTSDDYSRGDHIHAAPALNDLSNVSAATPSDNDVLVFDTATSTWVAAAPAGGGSSGTKTYAVFTPDNNQPTATAFATLDTRNSIAVLDYDDAATESAVFVGILPEAAALGSGLIVSLRWMATTATSGDVRWSVAWEKSNTDLDSDSFDTATAATATANGTSGIVTVTNITCTTIDSLAAGDLYRLRVQRVGGDGADTMTGDAELVAVEIRSAA
jgi:hypothetical protein